MAYLSYSYWGFGYVCFNYPKPMRKLIFYSLGLLIISSAFIFTYGLSSINTVDNVTDDLKQYNNLVHSINDTSFMGRRLNDTPSIIEGILLSSKVKALASVQETITPFIYLMYYLIVFLVITYLAVYVKAAIIKKNNNSTPKATD